MTPDFTINSVLLSLYTDLRKSLIERITPQIAGNIRWEEVSQRKIDPVLEAMKTLTEDAKRLLSEHLYGIHRVAASKTCPNTIGRFLTARGSALPEKFASFSARNKAAYAFLNLDFYDWQTLQEEASKDGFRRKDLTVMTLLVPAGCAYKPTEDKTEKFCEAICQYTTNEEFRGQFGLCERQRREDLGQDIYTLYQNDHTRSKVAWEGGKNFKSVDFPASSRISVIYCYKTQDLHIIAQTSDGVRRKIGKFWALTILGIEDVQERGKTPFQIQQFTAQTSAAVEVAGDASLVSAKIVGIEVQEANRRAVRSAWEAPRDVDTDVITMARKALAGTGLAFEQSYIRKITFAVTYRTPTGRLCQSRFWVSPESSNWETRSEYAKTAFHRLMAERGIYGTAC